MTRLDINSLQNPEIINSELSNPEVEQEQLNVPEIEPEELTRDDIIPVELPASVYNYTGVYSVNGKTGYVTLYGTDIHTTDAEESPLISKEISDLKADKEDKVNKVTTISEESTDTQYPSAKAVYNYASPTGHNHDDRYYLKSETDEKIATEKSERTEADTTLQTNINSEASIRESTDIGLRNDLTAETNTRSAADEGLQRDINAEVDRATKAEQALSTAIAAEEQRAKGIESGLRTDLSAEITRATTAEGNLSTAITAEKQRAEGAEQTLTTNLGAEVTRATAAEEELQRQITEGGQSIAEEVTRAKAAEKALAEDIAAEETRAKGKEAELNTAIGDETTRAKGKEAELNTAIGEEATRAKGKEAELNTAIGEEATTRANADTALGQRIDNLDFGPVSTAQGKILDTIKQEDGLIDVTTRDLVAADIPALDANKITSGTLNSDRIPNLDTSKITTGTFADERIASAAVWNAKQNAIDSTHKLSSDLVDDTGHNNKFVTDAQKTTWTNKQDAITSSNKLSADLLSEGSTNKLVSQTEKNTWSAKQDALPTTTEHKDQYLHVNSTTGNLEWADAGKVDDVVNASGQSYVTNKVAKILAVDNVTTESLDPLSAKQGKLLAERIENLEARGRYLAIWDCTEGYPTSVPTANPYNYKAGDYFIVGTVATEEGQKNYRPNGSQFIRDQHSTTEETLEVAQNDYYIYDGTVWKLLNNVQKEVSFVSIAGSPYDNNALSGALNAKQNTIDADNKLSADLVDDTSTTNKFVSQADKTNWNNKVDKNTAITGATKTKITYDSKGLVTAGTDLTASDIPSLDTSKITSGTFADARIASAETWNKKSVVKVNDTGEANDAVKFITIDKDEHAIAVTEDKVFLKENLDTYYNIGKITGASAVNPVRVADAGKTLKDVFNAILGTETDVEPKISTNTAFSLSASGTGEISALEMGATVSAKDATYTFTLVNSETAQYGLSTEHYDTHEKKKVKDTSFTYPLMTETVTVDDVVYSYNVKVEVNSAYHNIFTATTGTIVVKSGNYIYCNASNNKVVLKAALPVTTFQTSAQTRCGAVKAYVKFKGATYNGELVTNFYTYLGKASTAPNIVARKSHGDITTGASGTCTVAKGKYYPYYMFANTTTISSTIAKNVATQDAASACYSSKEFTFTGNYIYFLIPTDKTNKYIQQYVTGQWNNWNTTSDGQKTLTLNTGATATYNAYRSDNQLIGSKSTLRIHTSPV